MRTTMTRWNTPASCALAGLGLAALLAFQTKPNQTNPTPAKPKAAAAKPVQAQPPQYNRLKSGIEYRIYKRVNGRYTRQPAVVPATAAAAYAKRIGQVMALHVEYRTAKDSVLFQSRKQTGGYPVRVPLEAVVRKGGLEEAISLLQAGDSAVFRFNADSLSLKSSGQPAPPQIKKHGNTMRLLVKVAAIQSQADAMAAQQQMMNAAQAQAKQLEEKQKPVDDKLIQEYLQQNNLQAQKTASGLYYIVTEPGSGAKPTKGQTVSVHYRGTLLSGKEFDSSFKRGQPIDFPIGVGQVIPGWDEGIPLLSKGAKAVLLIPSGLAYGARGAGADIPPHAVLRFDVELVDIK
ncbi:FKBP-type peptidyl-prolyl cis-trans isomerase [Hymenobacter sp. 15J16-1T3B]|uniref:FKBP-type peptidyl-prolyl cis-trans isomerase n=1 Tax=Hymenobacter sp. 15J16-1T3B TaxID=2886941 RepID=UPI001D1073F4|nr:FKBP-type peptidyl-prolyl cis-trans isomerase [Hymenobacter sp. 15J16-1T3B]MCC3160339.1 FKBP-type peptidyl-prolyl cis-trans isomerase [Hymenobacter sp. 15J16-1T3B]